MSLGLRFFVPRFMHPSSMKNGSVQNIVAESRAVQMDIVIYV